jgi:hypothetical protein
MTLHKPGSVARNMKTSSWPQGWPEIGKLHVFDQEGDVLLILDRCVEEDDNVEPVDEEEKNTINRIVAESVFHLTTRSLEPLLNTFRLSNINFHPSISPVLPQQKLSRPNIQLLIL